MSSQIADLSIAQLHQAIALKERIAKLEKKLAAILGTSAPASAPVEGTGRRRNKMSAAGRARIAAAQRARWAKVNADKPATAKKTKSKRTMSAATRAKMAVAAKARWAKRKAGK